MPLSLHTIVVSTRPGRLGPSVGRWFNAFAAAHGAFDAKLVDLADFNLPLFDEPDFPGRQNYQHAHTRAWAASVAAADAFAFVTPEYNYTPPPSLVNAVAYLSREWAYKPVGFVSYGGVSGGLRSAQAARLLASTVKMMPIPEGVAVPNIFGHIDAEKNFIANELIAASAKTMLDELARWAGALKPLRAPAEEAREAA